MDVGFFLVGARLGFLAGRDVGFWEGRFGKVGFLVGLIVVLSVDCFKGRSSAVARAPKTAVITASDRQMRMVIMTTSAYARRTLEGKDLNLDD